MAATAAIIGVILNWYGKKPKDFAENVKAWYKKVHSKRPYVVMTTAVVLCALEAICLIWLVLTLHGAWTERQRPKSLPNMDGGTWVHVHPRNGTGFKKCTTAFTVVLGSAKYMVTAKSCLPAGRSTITTSDDPTGKHDTYTFAEDLDCASAGSKCLTADASQTTVKCGRGPQGLEDFLTVAGLAHQRVLLDAGVLHFAVAHG